MKAIIILAITTLFSTLTMAQFDEKFYHPSKEIIAIDSIDYEDLFINIDRDSLNYGIFKPSDNFNNKTIFYYHSSGGNISQHVSQIRPFVEAGYQLVIIDFRGYGKSTGKPLHANVAKDAQIIFDTVIKRDDIKDSDIMIYGASLGSQIATKMAKDNLDKVKALVLDGGMASFTDIAVEYALDFQKTTVQQYVTSPYSSKKDIQQLGNLPTLIIHSEADKDIPMSHAQINFDNASGKKELFIFEGGHLECTLLDAERLMKKLDEMMDWK